jgi:hypothetical protein
MGTRDDDRVPALVDSGPALGLGVAPPHVPRTPRPAAQTDSRNQATPPTATRPAASR